MMIKVKSTKMCTKKGPKVRRANFWVNQMTGDNLDYLREFYTAILGRQVSISLVVRRSLEMFADYIRALRKQDDQDRLNHEAIEIAKHTR